MARWSRAEDDEDSDDEFEEAIGSCEHCNGNVYPSDAHDIDGEMLCDQCAWHVLEGCRL